MTVITLVNDFDNSKNIVSVRYEITIMEFQNFGILYQTLL